MEIDKLKLDKFKNVKTYNFPDSLENIFIESNEHTECIIYYIQNLSDLNDFLLVVQNSNLPDVNRTILIYEKGRKDGVNRDSIFAPFKDGPEKNNFKLRAPMLCSLSKTHSGIVMSYEKRS